MISAMSVVPEVFRWAFWAGRNPGCVSGPSPESLCRMYPQHYMLHQLRAAGVSQRYSLDVNVYLLVLGALFNLRLSLFNMTRDDSGVESFRVRLKTESDESAETVDCSILFLEDDNNYASFFSPVLSRRTQLIHDLRRIVQDLDEVEILSR